MQNQFQTSLKFLSAFALGTLLLASASFAAPPSNPTKKPKENHTITCNANGVGAGGSVNCTDYNCQINWDGSSTCQTQTNVGDDWFEFKCDNFDKCSGEIRMEIGDMLTNCKFDDRGNCDIKVDSKCGSATCKIVDGDLAKVDCKMDGGDGSSTTLQVICEETTTRTNVSHTCTIWRDFDCKVQGAYDSDTGGITIGGGVEGPECSLQFLRDEDGKIIGSIYLCREW